MNAFWSIVFVLPYTVAMSACWLAAIKFKRHNAVRNMQQFGLVPSEEDMALINTSPLMVVWASFMVGVFWWSLTTIK